MTTNIIILIKVFMESIKVSINNKISGELFYNKDENSYGFNYETFDSPISLIMPCKKSTYLWKNKLHPIFDMYMPEGYLYQLFKDMLSKEHGYLDDFLVFSYLAPNIESRLTFKSQFSNKIFNSIDIDQVLHNDTEDTFMMLLKMFLGKNSISGVQPKTLALLNNKSSLTTKEYIIKTWGDEYPNLAQNEYFCLKSAEKAGIKIPNIQLSDNGKFLLVERFNCDNSSKSYFGFEEVLTLIGKNNTEKYSGSYEKVAKVIYSVSTNRIEDMKYLYKTVVMNFLLGNGDAHLKNFGVIYNKDLSDIRLSPAYDIVNTLCYIFKDKPALTIKGNKLWFGKKDLIKYGITHCMLSRSNAEKYYIDCTNAVRETLTEISLYLKSHPKFKRIGNRMIDTITELLKMVTIKEIPDGIIRSWN